MDVSPEREFGWGGSAAAIDLPGIHLHRFDRWLKDVDNGVDQDPPVMIFVMGADEWRNEADWPLPDTQYRPYYLHSSGRANTLHGDGTLSTDPSGDERSDVYLYNPQLCSAATLSLYPLRPSYLALRASVVNHHTAA